MKSKILNATLLTVMSLSIISCNQAEKFSPLGAMEAGFGKVEGPGQVLCGEAKDLDSCLSLKDICQPAYIDSLAVEKTFESCVANPEDEIGNSYPKVDLPKDEPKVEPKDEPKVEPKDGPIVEPKDEPKVEPKDEPKVEPKDEPKVEPKDEPKVEPKDEPKVEPKDEPIVEPKSEPTVETKVGSQGGPKKSVPESGDEVGSELSDIKDCSLLDPKYLVKQNKGQPKVLICHSEGNGSFHAIVVACPALKAHTQHHDGKDYLGACKED